MADYQYDVFISYSSTNKDWVHKDLLTALEKVGLIVFIDFRDFKVCKPAIKNMRASILESKHTFLVLTEAYLKSGWTDFENLLSQTIDPANCQGRIIPLLNEKCELPLEISYLTYVNFYDPYDWNVSWKQLFSPLSKPTAQAPDISARTIGTNDNPIESIEDQKNIVTYPYHWLHVDSSIIFHERLCETFPGLRDVEAVWGKEAADRLQILLREPLVVSLPNNKGKIMSFWWFRGLSNMYIERLKDLDKIVSC